MWWKQQTVKRCNWCFVMHCLSSLLKNWSVFIFRPRGEGLWLVQCKTNLCQKGRTEQVLHLPITPENGKSSDNIIYRVSREEYARFTENVPYVKVHRYNPKHLYPDLNGYGDNGERKVWSSCSSTYCTCFACCYPYTAHVRPSLSQPSQPHSPFIIDRCCSYIEL